MKLGDLPTKAGEMDAFHVPAIAVTSIDTLRPGDFVKFTNTTTVILCEKAESEGIVDPWGKIVRPGEMFWCCVHPAFVGELRHIFTRKPKVPL